MIDFFIGIKTKVIAGLTIALAFVVMWLKITSARLRVSKQEAQQEKDNRKFLEKQNKIIEDIGITREKRIFEAQNELNDRKQKIGRVTDEDDIVGFIDDLTGLYYKNSDKD